MPIVKVGFGHVGIIVDLVLSELSSLLLPLGGSVVWSITTADEGLDSGGGLETGPCRFGHWLQGNVALKVFASQSGKLPDRDEGRGRTVDIFVNCSHGFRNYTTN